MSIKLDNVVLASPEQMEFIIQGMRNPMNSWKKSDSAECRNLNDCNNCKYNKGGYCSKKRDSNNGYYVGENDLSLMQRLSNAGTEHRKYMRMMPVYVRITAPLYWWKEMDTYMVGKVQNSCSTMHKIQAKEFTLEDFSCEHICIRQSMDVLKDTIDALNVFRNVYLNGGNLRYGNGNIKCFGKKDKEIWWQMIQLLPSSYNQTRNIMLNYESLVNIHRQRKNHKLDEWREFCKWIESLPYSELITGEKNFSVLSPMLEPDYNIENGQALVKGLRAGAGAGIIDPKIDVLSFYPAESTKPMLRKGEKNDE